MIKKITLSCSDLFSTSEKNISPTWVSSLFKLIVTFFITLSFSAVVWGQTVTTNKEVYEPGEIVILTGSGFFPNEVINLKAIGSTNQTEILKSTQADSDGNFIYDLLLPNIYEEFYALNALGLESDLSVDIVFKDDINSWARVNPNNASTLSLGPGVTFNFIIEAKGKGGPVAGVVATWSADKGSPASYTSPSTGADGLASYLHTTPTTPGSYTIDAVGGGQTISFDVNITCVVPAAPSANSVQTFCASFNPTVANLIAVGSNLQWYSTETGGSPLVSTTPLTSATYYVSQTVECESTRTAVAVTLNSINPGTISKGITQPGPGCGSLNPGQTVNSTVASGSGAISYFWEQSINNGVTWVTAIGELSPPAGSFNPVNITQTTWYRRVATSTINGVSCSDYSNVLEFVVNSLPTVNSITPGGTTNVCVGSTLQLSNLTPGGIWSSGNASLATVSSSGLVTGVAAGSPVISYTVTDVVTGCSRTVNKTVNVLALPNAPLAVNINTTYDGTVKTGAATVGTGEVVDWYTTQTGGTITTAPSGTNAGTYTAWAEARNTTTSCKSATRTQVTVTIHKADAVVTVTGYTGVYDATAHGATGSATGVSNETLAGLDLGLSFTNAPGGTANWVFTDVTGNYNDAFGSVEIEIGKADATIVVTGYTGVYDALPHGVTGSFTGVAGDPTAVGASLNLGATFTDVPGGTANWTFTGGTNYNDQSGTAAIVINKAPSFTVVTAPNAVYDGLPHGATAIVTGAGGLNQTLVVTYKGVTPTIYPETTTAPTLAGTYNASASYPGDANHNGSSDSKNYSINKASTNLTLTLSAASVRYMDMITLTAVITPLNTATPITGSVEFKIGSVVYGTANVVPIPGSTDGSVQAMLIKQLNATELPGNYNVVATYTSTNPNYAGSSDTKPLIVIERSASYLGTSFYTGDIFVWTPTETSSTGTVALVATIKDGNSPTGDVRGAKVTFYYVNGSTYTPIPSATNLPVGLVNVSDGTVGTASAIVQLNIGNQNSASYTIAIGISGAYINKKTEPQAIAVVTVSKPVPGGYVVAGGSLLNSASSGILKGAKDVETSFSMDVQFNKKYTNPQGKSYVTFFSYNKPDGTLDNVLHQYEVASNAIAVFAVGQTPTKNDASFSSKSNLVEVLEDGTRVGVESGITLQLSMTDNGAGALDKFAITLYSKSGGVWFSSNWSVTKTVEQLLHEGNVYVSTSGLAQSTARTVGTTEETTQATVTTAVEAEAEVAEWALFTVKAYPNPSTDYFKLQLSGINPSDRVEVNVFDVNGRYLLHKKGSATEQFQFGEQLKSGVYFIEVKAANISQRLKVIKQ